MATEKTPLQIQGQHFKLQHPDAIRTFRTKSITGLAMFVVVAVVAVVSIGLCANISASSEAHATASLTKRNEIPLLTIVDASPPLDTTETSKTIMCGTAKNQAGYIRLSNKKDDHFFYWLFESRSSPSTDPLVLWLTGGAGCSSLMALLTENGPCTVNPDLTTTFNPYSWNTEANVVWLDQPSGTGFSYVPDEGLDHTEDNVQENLYWFLQGFLDTHPEFEGRPLFIAGESYAGHHIPAAAHYIWLENKGITSHVTTPRNKVDAKARINLQGIAIGNGLVDPFIQFRHFLDIADNPYNITLLNETQLETAKEAIPACLDVLTACQTNSSACFQMDSTCGAIISALGDAHRNMYDVRLECSEASFLDCYDKTVITEYLNSPAVRKYLNIPQTFPAWQQCSGRVAAGFAGDVGRSFAPYVADLLNDDALRVLIYHGDADLMCNWIGGLAWVSQLEWKHQAEFNAAPDRAFEVVVGDDKHHHQPLVEVAGSVRSFEDRLSFLRVFNSGHMVPRDQPQVALEMLRRFLRNEPL